MKGNTGLKKNRGQFGEGYRLWEIINKTLWEIPNPYKRKIMGIALQKASFSLSWIITMDRNTSPYRAWKRSWVRELWCCTCHLHLSLTFITIYFIPAARVITMVIVEFLIIESQIFINIRCGYYWQTQCQFLKKYGNFVIWGDSLFIIFLILMNTSVSYSLKIKQQKYPSNHFPFDWSAPLAKDPRRAPGSTLILLVRTSSHWNHSFWKALISCNA